ncbi:phosphatidate phosphatase [Saccharomycopsis crataegensis]|uniref:Phosphatidate phosphatase n=1 Tax=Saccharomycopsis crataegensis TaxID=43959 RepID=A0AAV5QVY2_9ASCO|nr:phosphatidate phosphatase [Saccharomycopsis crataegensis]
MPSGYSYSTSTYTSHEDDEDISFKKIGSFFNSLKSEGKPLLSKLANEARTKGSTLMSENLARFSDNPDYNSSNMRSEFIDSKDTSGAREPQTTYDENGNTMLEVPENSEITIYPSYTLYKDGNYYVEVRGWLTAPGTMNRKNRIVFSLAKQLIKPGSSKTADFLASNFAMQTTGHPGNANSLSSAYKDDDTLSLRSSASDNSLSGSTIFYDSNDAKSLNTPEEVLRQRIAYFFAKSLTNVPLTIIICSEEKLSPEDLITERVETDLNGKFELTIRTPYKPSLVQVMVSNYSSEPTLSFQEVLYIEPEGISVISDIDDTIKHTEVTSDKRTVFNNVFVKDLKDSAIEGTAKFYWNLFENHHCLFHYVSNSPWQLYPTIRKFFEIQKFPPGSIHLKQYTGNILSSLMEPAVERKRNTLYRIFEEFPRRKFLLIGDTGEQDFDAYLDVMRKFPSQVLRMYLRVVPGSLSDFNDIKVLRELRRLLSLRNEKLQLKKDYRKFAANLNEKHISDRPGPALPPRSNIQNNSTSADDSSSPETSEDEMEQPDYDWNILSHQPNASNSAHSLELTSLISAEAKATAAKAMTPEGSAVSIVFPKKKPPLPPRRAISGPISNDDANIPKVEQKKKPPAVPRKPAILKAPRTGSESNSTTAESAGTAKPKKKPPVAHKKPSNLQSTYFENNSSLSISSGNSDITPGLNNNHSTDSLRTKKSSTAPAPPVSRMLRKASTECSNVNFIPTSGLSPRTAPLPHKSNSFITSDAPLSFDQTIVKHAASDVGIITSSSSQATQFVDRKAELWLQKVSLAINNGLIPEQVQIMFWVAPSDIEDDCYGLSEILKAK